MADTPEAFPSLSEDGWIKDDRHIANKIFAHFIVADKHQSETTKNQVESLPAILQANQNDISGACRDIRVALESLFGRYFTEVTATVNEAINTVNPSKAIITVYVGYTDRNGVRQSLGRDMNLTAGALTNVLNLNNA